MNETRYDSALFAELYDVQPQAIFWMRPLWNAREDAVVDFEFVYTNEEGLAYLNLTREQYDGMRFLTSPVVNEALRKDIFDELIDVYFTGKQSKTSVFNPVLQKYARVMRTRLRDGVLTVVEDRTEEHRVIEQLEGQAAKLEQQTTLLNNILTNSSNGISVSKIFRNEAGTVIDAQTVMANEAAIKYIGLPKDVYLSRRATEIEPGIIGSPYYLLCIKTLETGEPFLTQYRMESTKRWLELTVSKLDYDHLIHVFTDVTPIKEAQLQLEQAAEQLQAVFNASQAGMFIFAPERDAQGQVVDFRFVITNPSFASYVGQTPEGLQGALGSDFFPGYLHNGVFAMYKHTYLTGQTQRQDVHYNVDEHDLYLDLMSTKLHDGVLVTFTDYTPAKKAQLQLERLVRELQQSNAKLEEFAHAASHDLKEPVRKISVFCDRLKSSLTGRLSEGEEAMFERMQNATERMALLIDDLLSYSHVSIKPLETEAVDLNKKIRTVLADLELPIEEKKAEVNVDALPVIQGYRRQLQQLFQNLIGNALKYSSPAVRPQINISASLTKGADLPVKIGDGERRKDYHLIEVQDNGIGFEQEHAETIFQLFQRLHGRSEFSGTGIGLAIARKVAANHNGYIWAESKLGEGATFFVALPA